MRALGCRLLLLTTAALLAWAPSAGAAETRTFLSEGLLFPAGNAQGTEGPANEYPSTVGVAGVAGTVTKVTVSLIDLESGNADDIDMALVGPNGLPVMLMSDACGGRPLVGDNWTFDDAGLSNFWTVGTVPTPTLKGDVGPAEECAQGFQRCARNKTTI